MAMFPAAGLQDGSRLQAAYCARKAEAQERRGNPRHRHGVHVLRRRGRRSHAAAHEVPAATAAEGEDALAQLPQQLHQGQRGGRRGPLQQPDNHGEPSILLTRWGLHTPALHCSNQASTRGHHEPVMS